MIDHSNNFFYPLTLISDLEDIRLSEVTRLQPVEIIEKLNFMANNSPEQGAKIFQDKIEQFKKIMENNNIAYDKRLGE